MGNKIIFEGQSRKQLRFHEMNVILLLLDYFNADITCIHPGAGKTPDLRTKGIEWEIKSPQDNGARTIENILKKAAKLSRRIIKLLILEMSCDSIMVQSETRHRTELATLSFFVFGKNTP